MADTPRPGTRTWNDGKRCSECCNGDRCDDPTHYDRTSKPGCPHCWNTGWALWTQEGQQDYAKYRRWDAYRPEQVAAERAQGGGK
jgi:hypothetical protein